MANKKEKVMEALSSRGKFSEGKKGVNLLGIVKKLSAKRKEAKECDGKEKMEEKDGMGGPGDTSFSLSHIPGNLKKLGNAVATGAKKVYNSHISLGDIAKAAVPAVGIGASIANKLQKNRKPEVKSPDLITGLKGYGKGVARGEAQKKSPAPMTGPNTQTTPSPSAKTAPMPKPMPRPGENKSVPMPNYDTSKLPGHVKPVPMPSGAPSSVNTRAGEIMDKLKRKRGKR